MRASRAARTSDGERAIISLGLPSPGGPGFAGVPRPFPLSFYMAVFPRPSEEPFMRVTTVAIALAGGAVLATACFRVKSAAAKRKDVLACSEIHPQAPEM